VKRETITSALGLLTLVSFTLMGALRMYTSQREDDARRAVVTMVESEDFQQRTQCMTHCAAMDMGELSEPCVQACMDLGGDAEFVLDLLICDEHCTSHDCTAECHASAGYALGPCLLECAEQAPQGRGLAEVFDDPCTTACVSAGGLDSADTCLTPLSQDVKNYLRTESMIRNYERAKAAEEEDVETIDEP